jgi:hypothetical protein
MKSFSWTTGWVAVVVAIVGALTAVDVMPILTDFLTQIVGAESAHKVGVFLSTIGALIAKLSHSQKPETPSA